MLHFSHFYWNNQNQLGDVRSVYVEGERNLNLKRFRILYFEPHDFLHANMWSKTSVDHDSWHRESRYDNSRHMYILNTYVWFSNMCGLQDGSVNYSNKNNIHIKILVSHWNLLKDMNLQPDTIFYLLLHSKINIILSDRFLQLPAFIFSIQWLMPLFQVQFIKFPLLSFSWS